MSLLFSIILSSPVVWNSEHVCIPSSQSINPLLTHRLATRSCSRLYEPPGGRGASQTSSPNKCTALILSMAPRELSNHRRQTQNETNVPKHETARQGSRPDLPSPYKLMTRIPRLALSSVNRRLNAPAKQGRPWSATNSLIACNACSPLPAPERSNGGGRAASNGTGVPESEKLSCSSPADMCFTPTSPPVERATTLTLSTGRARSYFFVLRLSFTRETGSFFHSLHIFDSIAFSLFRHSPGTTAVNSG